MKFRTLGRTGLSVSEIGHGTWGMAQSQWADADDTESRRALRRSFDLGVNFYDTALAYGDGHSETLVGELAREVGKEKVLIATKVPPLNREWPARCGVSVAKVFPPEHLRRSTEMSLRNLRRDWIDLQQLHVWQDPWLDEGGWVDELRKLKKEGKIRFVGVSVNDHDPASALLLAQSKVADVVQVIYNIFDPSPEDALFPLCREHKIGVIARVPFDEGGLTGKITSDTRFKANDFRALYFKDQRPAEVEKRTNRLTDLLGEEAASPVELALRFSLSEPVVSTVIPGMRTVAHVEENVRTADGRLLSPVLRSRLKEHAWARNYYP